ncbi:MAG: aldo/keto reductase [Casimicrobiaceae bacterium]
MALASTLRARLAGPGLALGGAPLGNLFGALDDANVNDVVRAAFEAGIRYFDTAPHYGHGLSERRMGDALRARPRDSYVLSTKVGRLLSPEVAAPCDQYGYVATLPFVQRYDYSGVGVRRSIEDSLQRLGLARVDLVFVHDVDADTHGSEHPGRFRTLLDDGLPALARLKEEGVIGGYGLGVNEVEICLDTLRHADLDVLLVAGRYTLVDQTALDRLLPECEARDVAVVLGGPFNSGILATGASPANGQPPFFNYAPAPPAVIARVAAIERVCAAFAVPLAAAALQFPRGHPAVACVLAGARSIAEVEFNLAAARHPIPRAFWQALADDGLVAPDTPVPPAVS